MGQIIRHGRLSIDGVCDDVSIYYNIAFDSESGDPGSGNLVSNNVMNAQATNDLVQKIVFCGVIFFGSTSDVPAGFEQCINIIGGRINYLTQYGDNVLSLSTGDYDYYINGVKMGSMHWDSSYKAFYSLSSNAGPLIHGQRYVDGKWRFGGYATGTGLSAYMGWMYFNTRTPPFTPPAQPLGVTLECMPSTGNLTTLHYGNGRGFNWGVTQEMYDALYENVPVPDPNDNNPNGPTVPEMAPGTFDETSDPIPLPDLPSISVVDCGLLTIYQPQVDEIQALSRYMWSDLTTPSGWWDTAKKIFNDPMQYLVAFNILPFDVPQGNAQTVKLAGFSTGVSMHLAAQQYVRVDCGTLDYKNYWGSALDYAPTTKMSCFLPFVGSVPIDPDAVTGTKLHVVYTIDILTGAFVANILADDNVLYHFNGNMATNVPLTGADYSRLVTGLLGAAASIALTAGAGVAAGTMAGVARAGRIASESGHVTPAVSDAGPPSMGQLGAQAMSARQSMLYTRLRDAGVSGSGATAMFAASAVRSVHNTAEAIMAGKPNIAITGQMSGCSGLMDVRYPYLYIQRPNQALPENYKHYAGYPSHIRAQLSSLSGYTTFEAVELSGIPCTDSELSEIYDILKEGVYM